MADSLTLLDMFARGIAVGAVAVQGFSVFSSGVSRQMRVVAALTSLSIVCWMITESHALWAAFGGAYVFLPGAWVVAGMFWLFVVTAFEDRPPALVNWTPTAVLLVSGVVCDAFAPNHSWLWAARNVFSGLLALHAGVIVVRGWSGDLLEARRRLRTGVLGLCALFAVFNTVIGLTFQADPDAAWVQWMAGRAYGGALFAVIMLVTAAVFLQARAGLFGPPRRAGPGGDARGEAAERLMLGRLDELMAAGAWRREGLTIGALAAELGEPEHRLRRLINQRLGHRNFADFLNGYRIEAAKARLANPAEARTTVAAIAFDLGYGSLGPFNRAFRAATGATPSEWRKGALQTSPELQEAV